MFSLVYDIVKVNWWDINSECLKTHFIIEIEWMGIYDTPFSWVFTMFLIILQNKSTLMINRTV